MSVTYEVETQKQTAAATILQRAVCLVLTCSHLGNTRRVALDDIDLEEDGEAITADKKQLRMSKSLLDTKELSQARHVIQGVKAYLRSVSTSGHRVFGPGTYLVPIVSVPAVEDRLTQFGQDLHAAVEGIVTRYPAAVEKAKAALGQVFDAHDYLSPAEVRHEFSLDWSYVSFAAPENLETVDRAVYEAAKAKHEGKLATAYDEVLAGLRGAALGILNGLVERLTPGPDGKPKVLRGTALRDLTEFIENFPARNLTDDDDLAEVLATVRTAAAGIDVEDLRGSKHVREGLRRAAEQAIAQLEPLVSQAERQIRFGSDGL